MIFYRFQMDRNGFQMIFIDFHCFGKEKGERRDRTDGRHINRLRALLPRGTYENIYIYIYIYISPQWFAVWPLIWTKLYIFSYVPLGSRARSRLMWRPVLCVRPPPFSLIFIDFHWWPGGGRTLERHITRLRALLPRGTYEKKKNLYIYIQLKRESKLQAMCA